MFPPMTHRPKTARQRAAQKTSAYAISKVPMQQRPTAPLQAGSPQLSLPNALPVRTKPANLFGIKPSPQQQTLRPTRRTRPTIGPEALRRLQQQVVRNQTECQIPRPALDVETLLHPPFHPLFDEVHPDNPLYKTARHCPCPCLRPITMDSETDLPPRNITAEVTKRLVCGHQFTYKTFCDVWFCDVTMLHEVEFPNTDWTGNVRFPLYAPHQPALKYAIDTGKLCPRCSRRAYVWQEKNDVHDTQSALDMAKSAGWSAESQAHLATKLTDRHYSFDLSTAIAEIIDPLEEYLEMAEAEKDDLSGRNKIVAKGIRFDEEGTRTVSWWKSSREHLTGERDEFQARRP